MQEPQLAFTCNYCLRKFRSRNAVVAHLRFCEPWKIVREARRQASAEPQADVPRQEEPAEEIPRDAAKGHGASTQNREERRSRRPSHESFVTLLKTEEDVTWLLDECREHVLHAELLGSLRPGRSTAREWAQLLDVLQRCHQDIEQMIFVWRLDHGALFEAYRLMLATRKKWLLHRYKDFDSDSVLPEEPCDDDNAALNGAHEAIQPEQLEFNQLIEKLRWLVVVSK
jgi:hypothetical protein